MLPAAPEHHRARPREGRCCPQPAVPPPTSWPPLQRRHATSAPGSTSAAHWLTAASGLSRAHKQGLELVLSTTVGTELLLPTPHQQRAPAEQGCMCALAHRLCQAALPAAHPASAACPAPAAARGPPPGTPAAHSAASPEIGVRIQGLKVRKGACAFWFAVLLMHRAVWKAEGLPASAW